MSIAKEILIGYITQTFKLEYKPREIEGSVCYAEAHDEMRPDFRLVFTAEDISLYLDHLPKFLEENPDAAFYFKKAENSSVLLPKNSLYFWKVVGR